MPTQMQMAAKATTTMISKATQTDQAQRSKVFGSGQNAREVVLWRKDNSSYGASLNCWGMAEQPISGNRDDIHGQVTSFLGAAG